MSVKIKELEGALAAAHLQIRTQSDSPEDAPEKKGHAGARRRSYGVGTGSLAIDGEGLARYYGDTSASEVCLPPAVYADTTCLTSLVCSTFLA